MSRTTLDIDAPVLEEVRRLGRVEKKSLGRVVSELLTEALARRSARIAEVPELDWRSQRMGARVDLEDKEALHAALDGES